MCKDLLLHSVKIQLIRAVRKMAFFFFFQAAGIFYCEYIWPSERIVDNILAF